MLKAVFFDLDGTLLPFDEDEFLKTYIGLISIFIKQFDYDKDLFVKTLFDGLKEMYKNDGSKSNDDVFWDTFARNFGEEELVNRPKFDIFYETDFLKVKAICKDNPLAKPIVDFCNENNLITVLATNPIIPGRGTIHRMSFVGLKESDFDYITLMESFGFTKPNPQFFLELLKKFDLKPEEVIMFGNNEVEDALCAESVGIKTYLIDSPYYIKDKKEERDFSIIKMEDVIGVINNHLEK